MKVAAAQVRLDYAACGFAVLDGGGADDPERSLRLLEREFGLGDPIVPRLYKGTGLAADTPYARVSPSPCSLGSGQRHPVMGSDARQCFHTDGLLEPLGVIRTSVLLCVTAATDGGATLIFESSAAMTDLRLVDADAFAALLRCDAMTRTSTIREAVGTVHGPIARFEDDRLLSAYSVSSTDRWNFEAENETCDLWRAAQWLRRASSMNRYSHSLQLAAGQMLLIANHRVSHGRDSFSSSGDALPRLLVRALYSGEVSR